MKKNRSKNIMTAVTIFLAVFGVVISAVENLSGHSFVILPIAGAMAYFCLKKKGLIIIGGISVLMALTELFILDFSVEWSWQALIWGAFMYGILALLGYFSSFLLKYGFAKGNEHGQKKLYLRISAVVTAFFMIAGYAGLMDMLCGNPIILLKANIAINQHISETYSDKNFKISNVSYNLKNGRYGCNVTDPDSEDTAFEVTYKNDNDHLLLRYFCGGKVYDTYEKDVLGLNNTFERLNKEFKNEVGSILDKYEQENDKRIYEEYENEYIFCGINEESDVDRSKLYLDMPCNAKNMPCETYIYAKLYSVPIVAFARVKEIAVDMDSSGYRIDYYDISIEYGDELDYYEHIPRETLLDAQSIADLKEYEFIRN